MIFIYGSEPKSQITLISAFKIECLGNLKEFQNKVSYLVSVYNWVLVVLFFLKKKSSRKGTQKYMHDFILNSIIFLPCFLCYLGTIFRMQQ